MAAEFEVSFDKAYQDLLRVKAEVHRIGESLDGLNNRKPSGFVNQLKSMSGATENLIRNMKGLTDTEKGLFRENAAKDMARQMERIATQALTTNQKMQALKNTSHDLHGVFTQMARDKTQTQYLEFAATSYSRLTTETARLQLQYKELNSVSGRTNLLLRERISELRKSIKAEAENASAVARNTDANGRSIGILTQHAAAQREMSITGQKVSWGLDVMTKAQAANQVSRSRATASIKAYNDTLLRAAERTQMAGKANQELAARLREVERLASTGAGVAVVSSAIGKVAEISPKAAQGLELITREEALIMKAAQDAANAVNLQNDAMLRSVGIMTASAKAEKAAADAKARKAEEDRKAAEATKLLTSAEASAIASSNRLEQRTTALNTSMVKNAESAQRSATSLTSLNRSFRSISDSMARGDIDKANNSLAVLSAKAGDASKTVRLLSKTDAEFTSRQELLAKMVDLRNRSVTAAAQANTKLTYSQKQLVTQLHQETLANERAAAAKDLSIRKMLGLRTGYDKVTHSMRLQQQAASALRATLSGLHASIGMYTSSTILAATATYAMAAAIRDTVSTGVEFGETMSRVEAIMFSGTSTYADTAANMSAVEVQIRSLGQSTIFTSNEVAKGMVDLGMAGLNATQAMEGLKPALDLASIGAISMSDSADIATNVLTTFKMEASELSDVVDIMATAVTNANTNVQQLANAITYVGPAAQAAGFSLKDTVATIELLSNAGIKASKAGTGLRRFMLNILNPTKKGQAVIDKYNISLYNMAGETRELTDIVSQFGRALMEDGVSPSERMAAIVDLVGVRAASAVSRMVSSFEDLELVRYQLEHVTGAADDMRKTIEDNLGSDWKKVISAFNEVQKNAFDPFEESLRLLAADVTVQLQNLMLPFDQVAMKAGTVESMGTALERAMEPLSGAQSKEAVSNATMLVYNIRDWAEAALWLGGAMASVKLASFASALGGADKGSLVSVTSTLTTKLRAVTMGLTSMNAKAQAATISTLGLGTAGKTATVGLNLMTGTLHAATFAARGLVGAITLVGRASAFVVPLFGWGLAIYAVGSAISSMLRDSEDHLKEHDEKVKETARQYDILQESILRTQGENSQAALLTQIKTTRKEVEATKKNIADLNLVYQAAKEAGKEGLMDDITLSIRAANKHLEQMESALSNAIKKAGEFGGTEEEVGHLTAEIDRQVAVLAKLQTRLNRLSQDNIHALKTSDSLLDSLRARILEAVNALEKLRNKQEQVKEGARGMAEAYRKVAAEARKAAYEAAASEDLSNNEKYTNNLARQAELKKRIAEYDAMGIKDKEAGVFEKRAEDAKELEELAEKEGELKYAIHKDVEDAAERAAQARREEVIKTQEMVEVTKQLAAAEARRKEIFESDKNGGVARADLLAPIEQEINALKSRKSDLESEAARTASRAASTASKDLKKAGKEMDKRIEELTERLFPERAIEIKFTEDMATLKAMLDKGKLDPWEYYSASGRLSTDKQADLEANNPDSKLGRRLSEDYLGYSNDGMQIEKDRGRITQEYGKNSNMETVALQAWGERRKENVLGSDVPSVSSEAFGAGDANKISQTGEDLEEWKNERLAIDEALFKERMEKQVKNNETEQQIKDSHEKRLMMIEETYNKEKQRLDQASNQVRYKDAAAMFGGMAKLSATLVGDNARLTQGLLAFQQAASLAATITNMAESTSKGFAQLGPIGGAAAMAGIVAQTASLLGTIGSVVSPSEPDTSTSSYAGAYDKGGNIPAGKYGVVGEYGPELVHGPAAVTGRKETAKMYGDSKSNDGGSISIAPQVNVTVQQQGSEEDAKKQGKLISQQVESSVVSVLRKEIGPNGMLDKWKRGKY